MVMGYLSKGQQPDQSPDNSRRPAMGQQHSEKIPHPETYTYMKFVVHVQMSIICNHSYNVTTRISSMCW